ncbi:MAG: 30S ribosomal protein S15 [Deltaproteobacteria bacterium]|nr:30S ribosomal protein S15 [Deltaproteobacteria bacterium]
MAKQTHEERDATKKVVDKFKTAASDTGSPEVQVALMTKRITELTEHLSTHKKDHSSRRGLLKAVGMRRRMLDYLAAHSSSRYLKLIKELDLRK